MTPLLAGRAHPPYVGLRPFEFHEAALFYGRGEHIAEMVRTLRRRHLLAVVGSSGTGKSSLVRAGLLPTIAAGFMDSGEEPSDWRFILMRPGLDPYGNLLRGLLPQLNPAQLLDPELVEFRRQTLRGGPRGLLDVVADSLLPEPARLVVLVDQFEEVFRLLERQGPRLPEVDSPGERRNAALAFVDMLLATVEQHNPKVYVVLTMRSEYLGECEAFLGLSSAIATSQFLTPRMTREQIQDIIERPIAASGGRIEPQVVTNLLNALGTEQDQLPRVEHVLLRMWERARVDGSSGADQPVSVTVDDYRQAGGFESALDKHAEQIYFELGRPDASETEQSEQQRIAEHLFRSLAVRSSQGTLVRRLSSIGEVASIARVREQAVADVVEHFRQPGTNFLVATPPAPFAGTTTIDISHEALLRQWARLGRWLDEESKSADIYRRLAETAMLHAAGKASLWRDSELQLALEWRDRQQPNEAWASRYHPEFESAMRFLDASVTLRQGQALGLDSAVIDRLNLLGYRIEDRIDGGRLPVYRARRIADDHLFALKIDTAEDDAGRSTSSDDAVPVKRVSHATLVPIVEVHDEERANIIITEWVKGLPITPALEMAGWDVKAGAIAAICEALEHAHQQGVIHGNIRPAKLLIGPDGRPKVLGLGLSRLRSEDNDFHQHSAGKAERAVYRAPEQMVGREPLGPAADVYSLGVVFYELLVGRPPFLGDSFRGILDAHLHDAPELPTLRRDDVPEPLQRICLKALEKTPADRYRSMAEMRADLERYRRGEPVWVRPSYYNNLMESPAQGHVIEIDRWHKQALITDNEHVRLRRAYQVLTRSGLQAISESRLVHWRVSLLYLGGWLVLAGAALWLELHYSHPDNSGLWLAGSRSGRVLISLVPTLLTNGLWGYFHRRGSYRFAFAAMVLGLLSLPFAVGVTVHEIADRQGNVLKAVRVWQPEQSESKAAESSKSYQVFTDDVFPNVQLFIALFVAVLWGTYVGRQSWTRTSAAIVSLHFLACYLVGLDFWGLRYFFDEKVSYGGVFVLPAAAALIVAGVRVGQLTNRSRQAMPLFAFAMIVTFLASQAIALQGPKDRHWAHPDVWTGAIEVALGIGYFALARYLRARFRIEAAAAHQVLAQLAPVTFLTGLALMDSSWQQDHLSMAHYLGFGKLLTPWAPMLLASAIIAVMLATWVQSYFYISCGLVFLAYVLDYRIGNEDPLTWPWPFAIMTVGFLVVVVMRWRNAREQAGEDIDDVGELLIQRSRRTSSFSARDRGRAKGSAAR